VNETKIMTAANEMVDLGLKDAGYEYVNSKSSLALNRTSLTSFQSMIAGLSNQEETAPPTKLFPTHPSSLLESTAQQAVSMLWDSKSASTATLAQRLVRVTQLQ
jgi:hypothetical protein